MPRRSSPGSSTRTRGLWKVPDARLVEPVFGGLPRTSKDHDVRRKRGRSPPPARRKALAAFPGPPASADREALEGILFVLRTGINWQHLPTELGFGSGVPAGASRRVVAGGVWERLPALCSRVCGQRGRSSGPGRPPTRPTCRRKRSCETARARLTGSRCKTSSAWSSATSAAPTSIGAPRPRLRLVCYRGLRSSL